MGIDQTPVSHTNLQPVLSTQEKALAINLDASKFGTFAEIGAGQEVARWFFHVGHASATVAKSMSAYDMVISDIIYGPTDHYVSRARLDSMLDHEWGQLLERLDPVRGERSGFFVFADTVAMRSRTRNQDGQGWMGIRFQAEPRAPFSQIIIHVNLLDHVPVSEQEALGILGVNLVYGAFHQQQPEELMKALMEGLSRQRVDIDMIKFSGPAFRKCGQPPGEFATGGVGIDRCHDVYRPGRSGAAGRGALQETRPHLSGQVPAHYQRRDRYVEWRGGPVQENSRGGGGPGGPDGDDPAGPGHGARDRPSRLSRSRRYARAPSAKQ